MCIRDRSKILNERGAVTTDVALRLSRALDTTPELWLNLQRNYDLWHTANGDDCLAGNKPYTENRTRRRIDDVCIASSTQPASLDENARLPAAFIDVKNC